MTRELLHPRHWPSWVLVGFVRLIGLLPFPLLYGLGKGFGYLAYVLVGGRRRVAMRNLEICFAHLPQRSRRKLAIAHFGYLGVAALTQGLVWGSSRQRLARIVRFRDLEHFERLHREGRNLIIIVPHFAGMELAAAAFTGLVHPGVYMYQKIRDPVIDAEMRRSRMRFGSQSVERHDDLRGLIREIRKGLPFYYLPDQDPGRRGIFVPFCGIATSTVPTLSRFARLGDALVLSAYARYLPWGRGMELLFDPPFAPFPTDDQTADAALMNRAIEARMRTMPEQYFWVHRRFKTRPPGEPPIYEPRRRR